MYEKLMDLNVLHEAFQKCKKGVDWKCSVQQYEANEFLFLNQLVNSLKDKTYKQKPFVEFDINERGKQRHIKSLHISDRVLQRALCDEILLPIVQPYLIYDNGASIKGKGIDFSRERLRTHLQRYYRKHGYKGYILQVDYSKYFDSIPHDKIIEGFKKLINDQDLIDLIIQLVDSFGENVSVGIGSQISQIIGIYYLTKIDNYCTIVKGCKYYGRYMDDLYVIHHDKEFLKQLLVEIEQYSNELGLKLNTKKTQINRIDKCFIFLKLRTRLTPTGKVIRNPSKKNITRMRRKLKKLKKKDYISDNELIQLNKSFIGNLKKYQSYHTIQSLNKLMKNLCKEGKT